MVLDKSTSVSPRTPNLVPAETFLGLYLRTTRSAHLSPGPELTLDLRTTSN